MGFSCVELVVSMGINERMRETVMVPEKTSGERRRGPECAEHSMCAAGCQKGEGLKVLVVNFAGGGVERQNNDR